MSFKWTPEEDAILEAEWAAGTIAADIARNLPGRTPYAVNSRAKTRGLPRRVNGRKHRPWTEEDTDALLAMHAANKSIREIAHRLGRSRMAVDWRLAALGAKLERHKKPAAPAERIQIPCLGCGHTFSSESKRINRFCKQCKKGSAWRSGGDFEARV